MPGPGREQLYGRRSFAAWMPRILNTVAGSPPAVTLQFGCKKTARVPNWNGSDATVTFLDGYRELATGRMFAAAADLHHV